MTTTPADAAAEAKAAAAAEAERIAALKHTGLLDTAPEERFDRITRMARDHFKMPIALVSLVDVDRQWFKSRIGTDLTETPRADALCGHAVLADDALIVRDATIDPRFMDNPLVTGSMHLRFYAGVPLRGVGGQRVGTLCIIDYVPREFDERQVEALRDLAQWATLELNATSLSQAAALAHEKEARLIAIVDYAGDGIVTLDDAQRIESMNPAAARMFDYVPLQVLGEPISCLLTADCRRQLDADLHELAAAGRNRGVGIERQVTGRRDDGSSFPAELVLSKMWLNERFGYTCIVRDISDRHRIEQALRMLNQELATATTLQQAILDSANFSIVSTDIDGVIGMANLGAQRMLGYTEEQLVGLHTLELFHDCAEIEARSIKLGQELGRLIAPGMEVLTAAPAAGMVDEHEWTYVRRDHSTLPVMLSVSALWDAERRLTGFLAIAYDLTERKKIDNMKSEFISTVSHELRTPLTSIRGSLGLMAGGAVGEMPARAKPLLDIANNNCERLVRLINDILDIEKIESGNMRFQFVPQRLLPLVEQAIAATQAYAIQFNVRLELSRGAVDGYVAADADRVMQVMINLLSNAIKFSRAGATVEVRLVRLPNAMRLSVTNYGEGISDEFRNRIFQKFAQADSSDTRAKGGTGLGLSICKAIIEKHLGRVDFSSEPGVLTEFFFELPHAMAPLESPALQGEVLICDPDVERANALGMTLVRHGITSDIAGDPITARRLLARGAYVALVLMRQAPEQAAAMTLTLEQLEAPETGIAPSRRLPVVVVGATAADGAVLHAATADRNPAFRIVASLAAPVDESALLAALRNAMREGRHAVPRILYLERDPDLVQVVTALLDPAFSIRHANSLAVAHRCLCEERFDVILTDLQLSDGPTSLLLAELPLLNADTPVVVFSDEAASAPAHAAVRATLTKSQTSTPQMIAMLYRLTAVGVGAGGRRSPVGGEGE